MNLKALTTERPKRALAMISIGMGFLVIASLSPRLLHPSARFGPDRIDLARGFLFGVSFGITLAAVVKIARWRRAARTLALLLGLGVTASSVHAGPVPTVAEPHAGSFTTSDGVKLHYLEAGKGPAIVFVPEWTMPGWIWDQQIRYFAEHFRVVALDPRSQGESEKTLSGNDAPRRARDVKELVEALHLAPAVLVAWSLAVPELLTYAEQFGGDGVRGYVLVDGFAWQKQDPQFVTAMMGLYRQVQTNRRQFTEAFVRSMYRKPQPEEYIQRLVKISLEMPADSAVAASVSSVGRAWNYLRTRATHYLWMTRSGSTSCWTILWLGCPARGRIRRVCDRARMGRSTAATLRANEDLTSWRCPQTPAYFPNPYAACSRFRFCRRQW